jgi:hypothetical protein
MVTVLSLRLAIALVIAVSSIQAQVPSRSEPKPIVTLQDLTWRTGWIPLGDVSEDLQEWVASSDPSVAFFTGTFEIVGKTVDRRKPITPAVGERIRLAVPLDVVILGYATRREERRLDPPLVSRGMLASDLTGIRLERGTIVEVHAVHIATFPPGSGITTAWARVGPVPP